MEKKTGTNASALYVLAVAAVFLGIGVWSEHTVSLPSLCLTTIVFPVFAILTIAYGMEFLLAWYWKNAGKSSERKPWEPSHEPSKDYMSFWMARFYTYEGRHLTKSAWALPMVLGYVGYRAATDPPTLWSYGAFVGAVLLSCGYLFMEGIEREYMAGYRKKTLRVSPLLTVLVIGAIHFGWGFILWPVGGIVSIYILEKIGWSVVRRIPRHIRHRRDHAAFVARRLVEADELKRRVYSIDHRVSALSGVTLYHHVYLPEAVSEADGGVPAWIDAVISTASEALAASERRVTDLIQADSQYKEGVRKEREASEAAVQDLIALLFEILPDIVKVGNACSDLDAESVNNAHLATWRRTLQSSAVLIDMHASVILGHLAKAMHMTFGERPGNSWSAANIEIMREHDWKELLRRFVEYAPPKGASKWRWVPQEERIMTALRQELAELNGPPPEDAVRQMLEE